MVTMSIPGEIQPPREAVRKGAGEACRDGMKNANNQIKIEEKQCMRRWDQKKIPYWTWVCGLHPGLGRKNIPIFDCKQECHFIDLMILFFQNRATGREYAKNHGRPVAYRLLWVFRGDVQQSR